MAKFTIELELPDSVSREVVKNLLADALGEFRKIRNPPTEYVAKRYPEGYCGDHKRDAAKVAEVADRINLATLLKVQFQDQL